MVRVGGTGRGRVLRRWVLDPAIRARSDTRPLPTHAPLGLHAPRPSLRLGANGSSALRFFGGRFDSRLRRSSARTDGTSPSHPEPRARFGSRLRRGSARTGGRKERRGSARTGRRTVGVTRPGHPEPRAQPACRRTAATRHDASTPVHPEPRAQPACRRTAVTQQRTGGRADGRGCGPHLQRAHVPAHDRGE
jgi:hypothetical protein